MSSFTRAITMQELSQRQYLPGAYTFRFTSDNSPTYAHIYMLKTLQAATPLINAPRCGSVSGVMAEVQKRFEELDALEDTYDDRDLYCRTKKLLLDIIKLVNMDKRPLIGVRDEGQVDALWCGINGKDVLLVPYSKKLISVSCVSSDFDLTTRRVTFDDIRRDSIKELT